MSHENLSAVERNALKIVARGHKVPRGILAELVRSGLVVATIAQAKIVPQGLTPLGKKALREVQE